MIGTFALILLIFIFALIYQSVIQIPQGYAYTLERFGRYIQTLEPGLHVIFPVIDRIGARINLMERVLDIPSQDVISRDNAMVRVDGVCFFRVVEPSYAAYRVLHLEKAVTNIIMTNIRTALGSMDLDEMLSHRDQINEKLLHTILGATEDWGIKVTRIEIRDIHPPENLIQAMAAQMKAEREKRARILEAEGIKQAEILKAEGIKQSRVLQAESEKIAKFLEAEARERTAEAEKIATEKLNAALSNSESQAALQYYLGQQYIHAFSQIASSADSKTIFVPYENGSMISAIGAIKELFVKEKS